MSYSDAYDPSRISQTTVNPIVIENQNMLTDSAAPGNCGAVPADPSSAIEPTRSTKRPKKVKSNKSQWRKEKGNKYLNKPYVNYKGIQVKSKEFVDYDCKCQMKCKDILTSNERKQEFHKFWELGTYEAQAIFLIARVDEQVTKKSTKKSVKDHKEDDKESSEEIDSPSSKKSKRQFSRTYILKSKQVCRNMFVKTLGITSKRINTALVKMRSRNVKDERGVSQGGKNKISDNRFDEVVDHIKKMPRYKCNHMQGKFNPDYLPPELSLSKMYELYSKEVDQPVSLSMYKKVYYGKFNFKTKTIKKEICNICKGEKKLKQETIKKQSREKLQFCSNPEEQVVLQHHQYRTNYLPPPPQIVSCSQHWLSPNFQMTQHNASQYYEQSTNFEQII